MIDSRMWDDPDFIALDDTTARLWFYLLTGLEAETGCAGLMVLSPGSLAAALRKSPVDIDASLRRLSEMGWLEEDRQVRVIRIPRAPLYRIGHDTKAFGRVVWKWYRAWCRIPDCVLKDRHVSSIAEVVDVTTATWKKTFGKVRIDETKSSKPAKPLAQLPLSLEKSENVVIPKSHTLRVGVGVGVGVSSSGQDPERGNHLPRARARNEPPPEPEPGGRPRAEVLWERLQAARKKLDLPVELPTPGALGRVQSHLAPYGKYAMAQLEHCIDAAALAASRDEADEWKLGPDLWHPNVLDRLLTARASPRKQKQPGGADTDLSAHWAAIEADLPDEGPLEIGPMPWDVEARE